VDCGPSRTFYPLEECYRTPFAEGSIESLPTTFLLAAQIDGGVTKKVDKLPVTEEARCFNLHNVWYSVPPGVDSGTLYRWSVSFRDRNIQTPKETPLTITPQSRLSTLTAATLEFHAPSLPTVNGRVLICARSGAGAFSIDY
jgi:hypothetical protein